VKAGLEQDKAALLVALAALSDGRKVVLAVTPGHRESTASWAAVLRDLRERGLRAPRLIVGDGHLERRAPRVSRGGRTAVLESPAPQCRRSTPQAAAERGQSAVMPDPVCADSSGSGTATRPVSALVSAPRIPRRGAVSGGGLGSARGVLSGSTAALATSADDEPRGIAVCRRSITHRCGEAISAGEECDSSYLEDALSGGTGLSPPEASGVDARRLSRRNVHGWHIGKQRGRRLISIYTRIDDTSNGDDYNVMIMTFQAFLLARRGIDIIAYGFLVNSRTPDTPSGSVKRAGYVMTDR
jgi:hypothetical protein